MNDPPIFIVGCPRSGTGLLRDLLRSHPALSLPMESHFIPALYRAYGDPRDDHEARRLGTRILRTPWIERWGIRLDAGDFDGCRSYGAVVDVIFSAWARREGKRRWGDKTPLHVVEMPTLLRIFPTAQFVHIYRDGRDVALSLMRAHIGPENVFTAARYWKRLVSTGRRVGSRLPAGVYHEVPYERLLSEPESTMRGLCDFLDEPFDEAVLRPNFLERQSRPFIFGERDRGAVSRTEIVASNQGRWRQSMAPADRVTFESVAGDLLDELGYETEGHRHRISGLERRTWALRHGLAYLLYRLNLKEKKRWAAMAAWMWWAKARHRLRRLGVLGPPIRPPDIPAASATARQRDVAEPTGRPATGQISGGEPGDASLAGRVGGGGEPDGTSFLGRVAGRDQRRAPVAGPTGLPVLGHLPAFLRDKLGFLSESVARYGDVVELKLPTTTYLLNDPEDIGHVLVVNHSNYNKTPRLASARGRRLAGSGLLTRTPATHRRQRRLLQPAFHYRFITGFGAVVSRNTQRMLERWQAGDELDIETEMARLARQNIVEAVFGVDTDGAARWLGRAIEARQRYIEYVFGALVPFPEYWPTPTVLRYRRAMRDIDAFVYDTIRRRRAETGEAETRQAETREAATGEAETRAAETRAAETGASDDLAGDSRVAPPTILDLLLAQRYEDGTRMSDTQVRDEAVVLSLTGYETVGEALTWIFYRLTLAPGQTVVPEPGVILRPRNGLRMAAARRRPGVWREAAPSGRAGTEAPPSRREETEAPPSGREETVHQA